MSCVCIRVIFLSLLQSKLGFIARLTYKILDIQCRNVLTPTNGAQKRIMKKISTLTCVNMNRIFMHLMSFFLFIFFYFLVPLEDLIAFSVFFLLFPAVIRCSCLQRALETSMTQGFLLVIQLELLSLFASQLQICVNSGYLYNM